MERTEVFKVIDGERRYQQESGKPDCRSEQSWVKTMLHYMYHIDRAAYRIDGTRDVKNNVRKLAAVCVAMMEDRGTEPREGYEGEPSETPPKMPIGVAATILEALEKCADANESFADVLGGHRIMQLARAERYRGAIEWVKAQVDK